MMIDIEVFNPHEKSLEELPTIFCFANNENDFGVEAIALSEDGVVLGGHLCSSEFYIPGDLGVRKGSRDDRHKNSYQKHYPDGYKMEFVSNSSIENHKNLMKVLVEANKKPQTSEDAMLPEIKIEVSRND